MKRLLLALVILLTFLISDIRISYADEVDIVAKTFLGSKYKVGGTTPKHGFDCSAFVQYVFNLVGVDLPRTVSEQIQTGIVVLKEELTIGDLVFFKRGKSKRPSHVGIYIGDGKFIHSSNTRRKVRIDDIESNYFSSKFLEGRRVSI